MLKITVYVRKSQIGTYEFEKNYITIGRNVYADIFLEGLLVSRKHALIRRSNNDFIIEDTGSMNGVFLNGQRVFFETLKANDVIQVGEYKLTLNFEKAKPSGEKSRFAIDPSYALKARHETKPSMRAPVATKKAQWVGEQPTKTDMSRREGLSSPAFLIQPEKGLSRVFPLKAEKLKIGSALMCEIKLEGKNIDKIHASLAKTHAGWIIFSLSPLVTTVNEKALRAKHLLHNGDKIQIGFNKLTFVEP